MKTLHLLRHAKSSWREPELSDRDRGLNKRGRRDAPRIGAALAREVPAMQVHCSPARRAQLTLAGLCEGWPELAQQEHSTESALYTFSSEDLYDWIAQIADVEAVFLIGHNPALTDLINELVGKAAIDNLPTAGYARLGLDVDHWGRIRHGCAVIERRLIPRELSANN